MTCALRRCPEISVAALDLKEKCDVIQQDDVRMWRMKHNILDALGASSVEQMRECRRTVTAILRSLHEGEYELYYLLIARLLLSVYARREKQAIDELPLTFREYIGPIIQSRPPEIFTCFPSDADPESQRTCVTQWRDILLLVISNPLQDSKISTADANELEQYFRDMTVRGQTLGYRRIIIECEGENLAREKIWFEHIRSDIDLKIKWREQPISVSPCRRIETLPPADEEQSRSEEQPHSTCREEIIRRHFSRTRKHMRRVDCAITKETNGAEEPMTLSLHEVRRGQPKLVTVNAQRSDGMVATSKIVHSNPNSEKRLQKKIVELSTELLNVSSDTMAKIQAATKAKDVAEQELLRMKANLVEKDKQLAEISNSKRSLEQERREREKKEKGFIERWGNLAGATYCHRFATDKGCQDEPQRARIGLQEGETGTEAEPQYVTNVDNCIEVMYKKLWKSQQAQDLAKKVQKSTDEALQRAKKDQARYKKEAEDAKKNVQQLRCSLRRLTAHLVDMQKHTGEYKNVLHRSELEDFLKDHHLSLTDQSREPAVEKQPQSLTNEQRPSRCDFKSNRTRAILPKDYLKRKTKSIDEIDEKHEYNEKLHEICFQDCIDRHNVSEKDAGDPAETVRKGQPERCTSRDSLGTVADTSYIQGASLLIAMLVSLAMRGRRDLSRNEASPHAIVSDSALVGLDVSVKNVNILVENLRKFEWNLTPENGPPQQLLACVNGWEESQRRTREAQLLLNLAQLIDGTKERRRSERETEKPPQLRNAHQQKTLSTHLETWPSEVHQKSADNMPKALVSEHTRHLRKLFEAHMMDQFRNFCLNLDEPMPELVSSFQPQDCILEILQVNWEVAAIYTTNGMEKKIERVAMRSVKDKIFIFPRLHQVLCLNEAARATLYRFCKDREFVNIPIALEFAGVKSPPKGNIFTVTTKDDCTFEQRLPGKKIAGWGQTPASMVNQEAAFRELKSKAVEDVQEHILSCYRQVGLPSPLPAKREADLDDIA